MRPLLIPEVIEFLLTAISKRRGFEFLFDFHLLHLNSNEVESSLLFHLKTREVVNCNPSVDLNNLVANVVVCTGPTIKPCYWGSNSFVLVS